eukprot:Awhi_evm1s4232
MKGSAPLSKEITRDSFEKQRDPEIILTEYQSKRRKNCPDGDSSFSSSPPSFSPFKIKTGEREFKVNSISTEFRNCKTQACKGKENSIIDSEANDIDIQRVPNEEADLQYSQLSEIKNLPIKQELQSNHCTLDLHIDLNLEEHQQQRQYSENYDIFDNDHLLANEIFGPEEIDSSYRIDNTNLYNNVDDEIEALLAENFEKANNLDKLLENCTSVKNDKQKKGIDQSSGMVTTTTHLNENTQERKSQMEKTIIKEKNNESYIQGENVSEIERNIYRSESSFTHQIYSDSKYYLNDNSETDDYDDDSNSYCSTEDNDFGDKSFDLRKNNNNSSDRKSDFHNDTEDYNIEHQTHNRKNLYEAQDDHHKKSNLNSNNRLHENVISDAEYENETDNCTSDGDSQDRDFLGVTDYTCTFENCGQSFRYLAYLEAHMRIHKKKTHQEQQQQKGSIYKCSFNFCGRSFACIIGLKNHMQGHADERSLHHCVCFTCGKSFKTNHDLTLHMGTHEKQPHLTNSSFTSETFSSLSFIEDNASQTKKFGHTKKTCEICGKSFDKRGFHLHRKSHNKPISIATEKPSSLVNTTRRARGRPKKNSAHHNRICKICGKIFLGDINEHMKSHQNKIPCDFPNCGKTFRLRRSLKSHMHIHSNEKL